MPDLGATMLFRTLQRRQAALDRERQDQQMALANAAQTGTNIGQIREAPVARAEAAKALAGERAYKDATREDTQAAEAELRKMQEEGDYKQRALQEQEAGNRAALNYDLQMRLAELGGQNSLERAKIGASARRYASRQGGMARAVKPRDTALGFAIQKAVDELKGAQMSNRDALGRMIDPSGAIQEEAARQRLQRLQQQYVATYGVPWVEENPDVGPAPGTGVTPMPGTQVPQPQAPAVSPLGEVESYEEYIQRTQQGR